MSHKYNIMQKKSLKECLKLSQSAVKWIFCYIWYIYLTEPGKFEFSKPSYIVRESNATAQVIVSRVNGADGEVTVNWKTTEMSAKHNVDFVGGEGDLTFKHGETSKTLSFAIMDSEVIHLV